MWALVRGHGVDVLRDKQHRPLILLANGEHRIRCIGSCLAQQRARHQHMHARLCDPFG